VLARQRQTVILERVREDGGVRVVELGVWVSEFTCKNVVFAPEVAKRATKVAVVRAKDVTPKQGLQLFVDAINRGMEVTAQHRDFDLLMSSVDVKDESPWQRIAKLAAKSDGVILHDRVLTPSDVVRLAERWPVVTLAGTPTHASVNIAGDNVTGMRELVRHLVGDHASRHAVADDERGAKQNTGTRVLEHAPR